MAVDNRPFKSKEQDGQGNEIIIRDQQLVEQGTATTMASGACFETRDVDDRPVKIPRDNMMNIVLECIGIILNDSSRNLGTNVQKALGLQGNTVGHSTVADFASVLGGRFRIKYWRSVSIPSTSATGLELTGDSSFFLISMGYGYNVVITGTISLSTPIVKVIGSPNSGEPTATVSTSETWPSTGDFRFRRYNNTWYFRPGLSSSQSNFDVLLFGGQ